MSSARLSPLALARSLPLLTLLAGSLAAGPAPTELTAQSFEASSLHLAGGEGAPGMTRRPEVKDLTRGPDGGNPTPKRQER